MGLPPLVNRARHIKASQKASLRALTPRRSSSSSMPSVQMNNIVTEADLFTYVIQSDRRFAQALVAGVVIEPEASIASDREEYFLPDAALARSELGDDAVFNAVDCNSRDEVYLASVEDSIRESSTPTSAIASYLQEMVPHLDRLSQVVERCADYTSCERWEILNIGQCYKDPVWSSTRSSSEHRLVVLVLPEQFYAPFSSFFAGVRATAQGCTDLLDDGRLRSIY